MLGIKLGHGDHMGPGRQRLEDVHRETEDVEHRDDREEVVLGLAYQHIIQ